MSNLLSETKQRFCELYVEKDSLKLTHELIAVELGISTKTIQRYLKEQPIIDEINRLCASKLDRCIPTLADNTINMLASKSNSDRLKASEYFFKLQEKLSRINAGNQLAREQELVQSMGVTFIGMMKDILEPEELCKLFVDVCWEYIVKKEYEQNMSKEEIEEFLKSIGLD